MSTPAKHTAFTPGPWFVFNEGRCVAGPESTPGMGQGIAMCAMRARVDEEVRANAALISAAPDLFASCVEFLPILERQLDSINPGSAAEESKAFQVARGRAERMRDAVAKALATPVLEREE